MATCQQCRDCDPIEPLIPACDNPEYCAEINYSRCIVYKGSPLTNLGVVDGETLNSILIKLNALLAP